MIWVILTALVAVSGAAKLNANYLPPISAKTAGGSAGALLAPLDGSQGLPTGSYTNDAQGVVVDAVNPGTRTSGLEPTGLGGPRTSYGSKDSKVGDAAFGVSGSISPGLTRIAPGFGSFIESDDSQADKASGNSLKFTSNVGLDNYSYGFEADNGISVGETGEAAGGVKAQGAYSYKGDDGKKYSVSYTADKGGYKPTGQHLPTPPPIPNEILISLEKNAQEEAAGHVDDGSYDGQKYNDEGDYSSNSAGNNNGRPTIGGGDVTSSGSYVSQSGQRPTSGILVGSYNPGLSSQGQGFAQSSGYKQSGFGINQNQGGSQGLAVSGSSTSFGGQSGQAGSKDSNSVSHDHVSSQTGASHSTENRFGVQNTKSEGSHAHAHASAGSPGRSPSFHNGASAYSSAVTTGSGSASAFASTGPLGSGLKNEYLPPLSSFGSAGQQTSGSDSSAGASFPAPSTATASASVSESQTLGSQTHSHSNLPSSASASASVSENQHSDGHSNQQVPSRFGEGQHAENSYASFASSTEKPYNSQQQGPDNSYYYKQPSKPFITPAVISSTQYSANRQPNAPVSSISQQGSKYSNTPATVATGQYQGTSSSSYNGITQASISPFPSSGSSSSSSQFASQSSQFGSKPSTQFGQTSQHTSSQFGSSENHSGHKVQGQTQFAQSSLHAPTQFGSTETHSGHQTQSQTQFGQSSTSQTSDSSKSPTQQYQGTIYQYNKPSTTLSGNNVQSQTQFGQSGQQTSSQFESTETHSGHKVQGQTQFVQTDLQVPTQSGSTETHFGHQTSQTTDSSQSPTQQYHGTIYQYNKPATTLPAQGHKDTSTYAQATATSGKPGKIETDSRFGNQQSSSQFGSQSTFQQTHTGSTVQTSQFGQKPIVSSQVSGSKYQFGNSGPQVVQKPVATESSIVSSNTNTQTLTSSVQKPIVSSQFGSKPQTTQGSSFTYSQSQSSQYGKKPISTIQSGVTSQQTQIGSGSQFGQNSQSTQGSNVVSTTAKPFGSSYQYTQFGSKPSTTQGSSFTYTQSQTSQFGKKPVVSTTQTGSQFGSGSQFGQNSQSTVGAGSVSTTAKPFGSSNQQIQSGSTGFQFGQNSQSTVGAGSVSTTAKPFGSSYQYTQFGSKPQTTQGSSYTYSQTTGQTSQFGKKPVVSTIQTGTQQTQFGSSSQYGQNSQSTFGSGSVSTTAKPLGSSYQQNQFGYKPSTTQGSSYTYTQSQTSQFGKKPVVSTTQTGSQFGSGSLFGQNSQSTVGAGSVSTTAKPFGSSYQYTQFGSKPQTTQGSSYTFSQTTGQTSQFGKKPVVSTTQTGTQFGSGSQFGQNLQSNVGAGSVSTTAKPFSSSNQHTQSGFQFGQNSQSSQGSGAVSTSTKPFGSSYEYTQFGSKPQTNQGSSYTYSQTTGQTSQFGKKPVVSTTQTGTQQTQFGSGTQFGQNSQSTVGAGSVSTTTKPFGSSYQYTQFGSKPSTTQGSSFTYTQSQSNQFEKKPVVSTTQTGTKFGSSSQYGQVSQSTVGAGSVSTTAKPLGSSYQYTQFGVKPQTTQGSSYTFSQTTGQTSQFGKKPIVSTTQTGTQFGSGSQFGQNSQSNVGAGSVSTTAKPFGSSNQHTQSGFQFGQNSQSTQSSGVVSTTAKPFGSSYQYTQFGSKPSTTQGSSFTYTQSQTNQFEKKPVVSTTQTGTQFGSGSQYGQVSQSTVGAGSVSTTAKPFGSSYQYTQFGSKPQTTQGSSYTYSQITGQTSQFGKKPVVSTTQTGTQQTQFGSGSQFGQNSQSTFGSSLVSTTAKPVGSSYQQNQFGSKPSTSFTYTQSQTNQFEKKPVVSTTQTGTQFGSGYQYGQASQSTVGAGSVSTTAKPSYGQKPFGSAYQQTQVGVKPQTTQGSSFTYSQTSSQFEKKPVSTTSTGVTTQQTHESSGSQFSQNPQLTQGSAIALTTSKPIVGIKPVYEQAQFGSSGSQLDQNSQSSQGFGSVSTTAKPTFGQTSFGSSSQNTKFGSTSSQFGQKPQTSQSSSFTSNTYSQSQISQFGKKPETGSAFSQTQFGSQFGQKPVVSTVTDVTSTTSQSSVNQKPETGSYYQQSQFGSTGSQFVSKPQSATQGSSYSSNTGSAGQAVQTSQVGITGFSQNTGSTSQGPQYGSGSGNKVSGSSASSGSNFQTTQFGQTIQTTQYGIKPFGSAQPTPGSTQFGLTPSRFGESSQPIIPISTISQIVEPAQFGVNPYQTQFGSLAAHFGQKPGAHAVASSSGSNVVPFSTTQTGQVSKYESSQFGVQNQGAILSTQKPVGSSLSQTNYQKYQYTQTGDKSGSQSQFGKGSQSNVGSGQIGQTTFSAHSQKPFGSQSTQTTYQQTHFTQGQKPFGNSQGSVFQVGQSTGDQPSQGTVQSTSVTGYNYQKPQSVFTTEYGSQSIGAQDQKVQQSQTNLNSAVLTSQIPINGQSVIPLGVSSTQGTVEQSQSTVSSSQFGGQAVKPTEFTGPVIQTSYNQFSGKPFQPASTVSTQGSSVQSQSSVVSTSQFGQQPTPSTEEAYFIGKPEYNVVPSQGGVYNPSIFSSTPSRAGSKEGLVVSSVQTPIVPVPGYELVVDQGTSTHHGASHSFVGLAEEFGGPRDPPRFDDKTGYHY